MLGLKHIGQSNITLIGWNITSYSINSKPFGHSHRYEPSVFTHFPPEHNPSSISHSLKSSPLSLLPTPNGQSSSNAGVSCWGQTKMEIMNF